MSLAEGGHPDAWRIGQRIGASCTTSPPYGLDANEVLDYGKVESLAQEHKPLLIVAGGRLMPCTSTSNAWPASPETTAR